MPFRFCLWRPSTLGRPLECGLEYVRQQPHVSDILLAGVTVSRRDCLGSYPSTADKAREFRQFTELLGASFLLHSRVLVGVT